MEAIQIYGAHDVRYETVPTPKPHLGEVLIRVRATGICGTDVEIVDGTMPYFTMGMAYYPIIPGHEWSGEIIELGDGVENFAVGDHVVGECSVGCGRCATCLAGNYHQCPHRRETGILNLNGGFAEYIRFPAMYLHKVPNNIPFTTSCLIEPTAIAFNGVRHTQITPRDYLVIFGDGPIGLLTLQVAKTFGGGKVVVVGATPDRLAKASDLGADAIIDVNQDDVSQQLKNHGNGQLPNAIIEATGNPKAAEQALQVIRSDGRVTLLGLFAGQKATINLDLLVVNDITLRGRLGSPNIWQDVIQLVVDGRIDPADIISHHINLEDFSTGIDIVKHRKDGVIKAIAIQE